VRRISPQWGTGRLRKGSANGHAGLLGRGDRAARRSLSPWITEGVEVSFSHVGRAEAVLLLTCHILQQVARTSHFVAL